MIYNSFRYPCKTDRCADFSDTKWSGKSYVYVWMDENNVPFYVGSGSGNRATSVTGSHRNKDFMEKVKEGCWVWFVAENINPRFVFNAERLTVIYLIKNGIKLFQKAYTNVDSKYGGFYINQEINERCSGIWKEIVNAREWVQGQHEPILKD